MTEQPNLEARVSALEQRIEEVAADAKAARHLAAENDRDLSEVVVRLDQHRELISALGEQTANGFGEVNRRFEAVNRRFEAVENRFDVLERKVDVGFAEIRGEMRAGFEYIGRALDTLIEREGGTS